MGILGRHDRIPAHLFEQISSAALDACDFEAAWNEMVDPVLAGIDLYREYAKSSQSDRAEMLALLETVRAFFRRAATAGDAVVFSAL